MKTENLIGNRYHLLEQIGKGGMGVVHRAYDHLREQFVALKWLIIPSSEENNALSLTLAHEFKTMSSLRHPNIVSVLDYGFHQQNPFFAMRYLMGAQPVDVFARSKPLPERLGLLAAILQALTYLHQRDVLHCDLKPTNVLVTPEGTVKLVDFGLAQNLLENVQSPDFVRGTLAYLAPEVLEGEAATVTADLYAFGVLTSQVLQNRLPFLADNLGDMIFKVLHQPPYLKEIPAMLQPILARLLHRNPAERYPDAAAALEALCEAAHIPLPTETHELRESFLKSALFVGRQSELALLHHALDKTITGQGDLWLVGGESGIGKSRLLDELETQALVRGVLVLRGQGIEGGGLSYQLWRDLTRRLILGRYVDSLALSHLREIIPDVAALVGREVPVAPALEGKAQLEKIAETLAELLCNQEQPILILLEDLQWTLESLEILKLIAPQIRQQRILIIGSYRQEEAPELPTRLPSAKVLRLERLPHDAIQTLMLSMLGERGRQPELLQLLEKETDGNPLFITEVMHLLAEKAGRLSRVTAENLSISVLSGGVEAVLQRHIQRLPDWAQPGLQRAAVLGRYIDLTVMPALLQNVELRNWLQACTDALLLEIANEEWRFRHDKVREVVLAHIPADTLIILHREVAQALEASYPDAPQYAIQLAHHWQAARQPARELAYVEQAARFTLHNHLIGEAIKHFDRALDLCQQTPVAPPQIAGLHRDYGIALWRYGAYPKAKTHLETALRLYRELKDAAEVGWVLQNLGNVVWRLGENEQALAYLQECIAYARQHNQRLLAYALNRLGTVYYTQHNLPEARRWLLEGLPIAYVLKDDQAIGNIVGNLGLIATENQELEAAQRYLQEALQVYRRQKNVIGQCHALTNLGHLAVQRHDLVEARQSYHSALELAIYSNTLPSLLEIIAGIAALNTADPQYLAWLGFVQQHAALTEEVKVLAQKAVQAWSERLPATELEAQLKRGAQMQLAEVLAAIQQPSSPG